MLPVIGVIPLWDDEKDSLWMLPGYMEGIMACGGLPLMLPLTDDPALLTQACGACDGFLLTGGHDVSPDVYHEAALPVCGTPCTARDHMEEWVLQYAIRLNKPVLGICRGIQFINAALGGTLYQDLPSQYASSIEHHMAPPYDRTAHMVRVVPGTPLYELLGEESLPVNSYHHQAVRDLAPSLQVMAISEDGLIEAVCLPGQRFLWGLQWHPEFAYRTWDHCRKVFEAFVNAAAFKG